MRINFDTEFSDKITSLLADGEKNNLLVSLSDDNPFLIQKLQNYGINSSNFVSILRHFSNDGEGQSWQNYIRGIFNTSYIKNLSQNSNFEFLNKTILDDSLSQPLITLTNESDLIELVGNSTKSNVFDFLDIYPFTNSDWVKNNLADGSSILTVESSFDTRKILTFNTNKKIISNFSDVTNSFQKRPITNFLWGTNPTQPLISNTTNLSSFYESRVPENQLITEGNVYYKNYSGFVTSTQTTSMFNTPFFVNAIQEGVNNFRNNDPYPYKSAAFLFLNSLPLATLREKYKTYGNGATTDLDYIFATIKKFGAIHKVPYAWILKIGSIWSRYKTYTETGTDFLNTSWSDFNYISNYDPITNSPTKQYSLIVDGGAIDIILEKNTVVGTEVSSLIHSGFYPKLINDFNIFYQGFQIYSTYTNSDIQNGFSSGVTLNYVDSAIIDYGDGFDTNSPNRSLRIIPWSVTVKTLDDKFNYVIPSQGSPINQVKFECFSNGQIKQEVLGNQSMYNGSVRTYWSSPQYGYFDISKITKPTPEQYLKNILLTSKIQENFSMNGNNGDYDDISEIFSVFEKDILDRFENEFLNFSRSIYDYYNFSKINNDVVKNHLSDKFEYLLFCNNDIVLLTDVIYNLITIFKNHKNVGTVGCRLHYEDNTLQHQGITIFLKQNVKQISVDHFGKNSYYNFDTTTKHVLGNTAALMMIRKNTFEKIGGFDESLRHCFEDVLLNLKLTVSGYSNYYSPDSVAYHLESASRDIKTTNNEMIQDYNNILVPYIKNNFEKLKKFVLIN